MAKPPKKRTKKYHPRTVPILPKLLAGTIEAPDEIILSIKRETDLLLFRLYTGNATAEDLIKTGQYLLLGSWATEFFENEQSNLNVIVTALDVLFALMRKPERRVSPSADIVGEIDIAISLTLELCRKLAIVNLWKYFTVLEKEGTEKLLKLKARFEAADSLSDEPKALLD